jgi:CheY-like chemotaxis protein
MSYQLKCHKCGSKFEGTAAQWCRCDSATASLVCDQCGDCFCSAPAPYRAAAWVRAPRDLRESPERFRLQHTSPPPVTSRHPVVLIVDDDEAMRSLVACVVQELGYRAVVCGDPEQALNRAASDSVDVVLTDALMPKLDGRELCRQIKNRYGAEKKVIIMTSLYKRRFYRNEAISQFGADELVTKPLDFTHLGDVLAKLAPIESAA